MGMDITILPPAQESGLKAVTKTLPDGSKEVVQVGIPDDADILVVQRPAHPIQIQMIDIIRSNGVAVVIDMDDDMSSIHPGNIAFHQYRHTNRQTPLSWRYATECCKRATMVTTSTQALQKVYAKHGRGVVIDNYVPEKTLSYAGRPAGGFGWAGTTLTHPADLTVVGDAVKRLHDEGFSCKVIGGKSRAHEHLRINPDDLYTGSVDLDKWIEVLAGAYQVGMIPLESSSFNKSKSRLKGIEHMAAGIPWVASPREEYRKLQRASGCGLLADTPKEWYTQLKLMLTDDVLRKEHAEMGREYMKDQTIQANAWRWAEAWEQALKIERG
jgi:glycosyltransferase involved in cell wall biosynthesis